jgi:hypothetical protein
MKIILTKKLHLVTTKGTNRLIISIDTQKKRFEIIWNIIRGKFGIYLYKP